MADAKYEVLEMRFKIEPELLQVWVYCGPTSDGTLGVQGWHHKTFPKTRNVLDVFNNEIAKQDYLLWGWRHLSNDATSAKTGNVSFVRNGAFARAASQRAVALLPVPLLRSARSLADVGRRACPLR